MANTRISELVVATTLDSNTQNTLLVIVDKSSGTPVTKQVELQKIDNVLDFTVDKANSAAIYANGAFIQANAAFIAANASVDTWGRLQSNTVFDLANLVFDEANSAFTQANTPSHVANSAAIYANGAFIQANAAFLQSNTPSYTANSASEYANASFIQANSSFDIANIASFRANVNFLSAETRLNVSNSSTTTYQFDQYVGTNPTIYVSPGRTVAFDLTYSNGYSFLIKESIGGSNVTTNLVHISQTGTITLNDEAQGKDSGILFWKVPFNYVNQNYAYECSNDNAMAGVIVVEQSTKVAQQKSNLSYEHANAGFYHANISFDHANAAFDAANSVGGGGGANTGNVTFTDTTLSPPDGIDLILSAANSQVDIQTQNFNVNATSDATMIANGTFFLENRSPNDPITIVTDSDGSQRTWEFDENGNLTAPGDITLSGDVTGTTGANTLVVKARPAGNTYIQLNENVDSDIRTMASLVIRTDVANADYQWSFGVYGDFDLPGNLTNATACSAINFVANSSGDGAGATTIELIPDTNLTGTDQYLIIDPTAPGHIHIRAGGIQDSSSADLFIGGEYSHLKVHAGSNSEVSITANNHQFRFGQSGYGILQFPNLTYADLPQSPNIIAGQRAFINDANIAAPGNFGATISGGGANNTPVWSDGINWFIG